MCSIVYYIRLLNICETDSTLGDTFPVLLALLGIIFILICHLHCRSVHASCSKLYCFLFYFCHCCFSSIAFLHCEATSYSTFWHPTVTALSECFHSLTHSFTFSDSIYAPLLVCCSLPDMLPLWMKHCSIHFLFSIVPKDGELVSRWLNGETGAIKVPVHAWRCASTALYSQHQKLIGHSICWILAKPEHLASYSELHFAVMCVIYTVVYSARSDKL